MIGTGFIKCIPITMSGLEVTAAICVIEIEDVLVAKLCKAIKPGGILGLIDHVGNAGGDPVQVAQGLHRIDPQVVRDYFSGSCFKLKGEAGFLGNSEDDHTLAMFDKSIRGKTDRFVFKFVRK